MTGDGSIIEVCELAADGWSLGLTPSTGAVLWCAYEQSEILRRTKLQRGGYGVPFSVSHFPLAPYSNRIRNGEFEFGGKSFRIPKNTTGQAHPLHGTAWTGAWTLETCTSNSASLVFHHRANDDWPWGFSLVQEVEIAGGALVIRLTLKNLSDSPMPAGLGFHPYFSNPSAAELRFAAEGYWAPDEENLPEEWRPAEGEFDFSKGKKLAGASIDQCFTGWRGAAMIDWRDRPYGIEITADPELAYAVVYVSQEENCFCFEPVSQMNAALNWAGERNDTGLRVLAPEEEWTVAMTMRIRRNEKKKYREKDL